MRVALCLSGQPRALKENIKSIKENFIDPYDADVFSHFWFDKRDVGKTFSNKPIYDAVHKRHNKLKLHENAKEIIEDLYKPKKLILENQKIFLESTIEKAESHKGDSLGNPYSNKWFMRPQYVFSMFYSIMEANRLKKEYEVENNFEYDCVIRIRSDLDIKSKFRIDKLDLDLEKNIYIARHSHCHYSHNDHFAFGSSKNMNYYSNVYNSIDLYYKAGVEFCPEILLGWHLTNSKVPCSIANIDYHYTVIR